ncbi:MAG: glucosaminidase domain-containing protein [Chitinophagaceae bacterium]|nr:glucosaminidase domain-containing protein [Chitinophagaceae bacterium]
MRKNAIIILVAGIIISVTASAQNATIIQYINTYKFIAIKEMQRSGVPASIKLAQGILETQAGTSDLVQRSNNHFGIKCKSTWAGDKVYHDDDESGECFRAYSNAADSYKDHSDFLRNSARYAFLFNLDPEDYEGWAKGLKKAGYATNPKYTQQVIKYIEDYNLNLYTLIALGKKSMQDEDAMYAANNPVIIPQVITVNAASNKSYTKPAVNQAIKDVKPLKTVYPQGEFRINETKVILAPAGSSLLAIADEYNVKYKHLLDFNEFEEGDDVLDYDQLIFLQRKRKQGAADFHIVQPGEDMYDIAQAEGIRLDNLLKYNNLEADAVPQEGQKVYLQKDAANQAFANGEKILLQTAFNTADVQLTTPSNTTKHIVLSKETLYSIAKKYAVGVDQLKSWNSLQGNDLKPGQELLIYKN